MTNSTSNNTTSLEAHTNDSFEKTTMQSLYELLGLHYFKTRAVFDVDGKELVYMNDNFFGRVKIYLDGEEIYKGWTWFPGMMADVTAKHQGKEYRVFSRIINWVSYSQKITVIVDDSKAQSKIDPVLGGLDKLSVLHAVVGPFVLGGLLGFSVSFLGS